MVLVGSVGDSYPSRQESHSFPGNYLTEVILMFIQMTLENNIVSRNKKHYSFTSLRKVGSVTLGTLSDLICYIFFKTVYEPQN